MGLAVLGYPTPPQMKGRLHSRVLPRGPVPTDPYLQSTNHKVNPTSATVPYTIYYLHQLVSACRTKCSAGIRQCSPGGIEVVVRYVHLELILLVVLVDLREVWNHERATLSLQGKLQSCLLAS